MYTVILVGDPSTLLGKVDSQADAIALGAATLARNPSREVLIVPPDGPSSNRDKRFFALTFRQTHGHDYAPDILAILAAKSP